MEPVVFQFPSNQLAKTPSCGFSLSAANPSIIKWDSLGHNLAILSSFVSFLEVIPRRRKLVFLLMLRFGGRNCFVSRMSHEHLDSFVQNCKSTCAVGFSAMSCLCNVQNVTLQNNDSCHYLSSWEGWCLSKNSWLHVRVTQLDSTALVLYTKVPLKCCWLQHFCGKIPLPEGMTDVLCVSSGRLHVRLWHYILAWTGECFISGGSRYYCVTFSVT